MNTCARCGLEVKYYGGAEYCEGWGEDGEKLTSNEPGVIACRDRELANLRSLLRSVTGKLEEAAEHLQEIDNPLCAIAARQLIDSVLEVLS